MRLAASVLLALMPFTAAAAGTDYPQRPIRFLVPSAPGGTPDIIARVVGTELGRQMGQSVVVSQDVAVAT